MNNEQNTKKNGFNVFRLVTIEKNRNQQLQYFAAHFAHKNSFELNSLTCI